MRSILTAGSKTTSWAALGNKGRGHAARVPQFPRGVRGLAAPPQPVSARVSRDSLWNRSWRAASSCSAPRAPDPDCGSQHRGPAHVNGNGNQRRLRPAAGGRAAVPPCPHPPFTGAFPPQPLLPQPRFLARRGAPESLRQLPEKATQSPARRCQNAGPPSRPGGTPHLSLGTSLAVLHGSPQRGLRTAAPGHSHGVINTNK